MRVTIDESGEDGHRGKIDDFGGVGYLETRTDGLNFAPADENDLIRKNTA